MSSLKVADTSKPNIVIIGAGVGGLSFGIALKRQLGFDNFTIFEKASDLGGTWRDNIYPGCSSDVAMHFFTLSTDLKPDWNQSHGSQAEIQRYWKDLSEKYQLTPHLVFNTQVVSAEWDIPKQAYHVTVEDVLTGIKTTTTAQILISAVGLLEIPRYPNIPGLANFKGGVFHSARWNTGIELANKRVAVIGNGASASQFIPIITNDPSVKVTQFIRTPNWHLPPIRFTHSSMAKWMFVHVPLAMRIYRAMLYLQTELVYLTIYSNTLRALTTKQIKQYVFETAPKEYQDKLLPDYPFGCKRMILDTDYLAALHRPNLSPTWDGIASITENGIVTKKGEELPFDVIILSTGFTADKYPLAIRGSEGKTVQEYYDTRGGPSAYLGTAIPGFPNLYTIAGPNTTTGHTSVVFFEEIQINYCLNLIKPVLEHTASSFEVTHEATDAYNTKIHARLARSVWSQCVSWYRTADGEGKITSIFPGTGMLFYWYLRSVNWGHYKALGAERWAKQRRLSRARGWFATLALGALLVWAYNPAASGLFSFLSHKVFSMM